MGAWRRSATHRTKRVATAAGCRLKVPRHRNQAGRIARAMQYAMQSLQCTYTLQAAAGIQLLGGRFYDTSAARLHTMDGSGRPTSVFGLGVGMSPSYESKAR